MKWYYWLLMIPVLATLVYVGMIILLVVLAVTDFFREGKKIA